MLCVGDVVIPPHLEKWVLEPDGDHKARHKRLRMKEERIAKWYALHGMYYKRKHQVQFAKVGFTNCSHIFLFCQSGFKRDPVDESQTVRQRRVGLLVQDALQRVIAEEFEHESVPGFSVEQVQMTVDLKKAKVLWNALESDQKVKSFLHRTQAHLRRAVTERVQLKFSPELVWIHSDHLNKHARVSELMERLPNDVADVDSKQ